MFIFIQNKVASHSQRAVKTREFLLENLYPIALLFLAFAINSCKTDSSPTGPQDRDDTDLWNSALVDHNGGAQFIAALRPDGIPRLYGGTSEYNYIDNAWTISKMGTNATGFLFTAIGKCKNDGALRMYGLSSTTVYEFNYNGNQWTMLNIATLANGYHLAIGDPRNDGFESLYIVSTDGLHEVRYQNSSWNDSIIDSTTEVNEICGGDGRGDGKGSIYIMDRITNIFELRYENASWVRSRIGQVDVLPPNTVETYTALSVTNSHNSHPNIVASASDIREFYYDADHWIQVKVGTEPGVNQIADGIGRNDGIDRIYCAVDFDLMAEYTLTGSSWIKTSQRKTGDISSAIVGVVVGPGRGDGVNRVYVTDNVGGLSEFSFQH